MNKELIINKINNAKKNRFINNCYSFENIDKAKIYFEEEDSFLFVYEDHGVDRIVFFASDISNLNSLLEKLNIGKYYIEFLTKNPDYLIINNSIVISKLMRMVNTDCNNVFSNGELTCFRNDEIVELASIKDSFEINKILWETFKTEISHLLYVEELEKEILAQNIYIHRSQEIDAILQVEVKPQKFYINQIINKTESSVIHAILLSQLWKYTQNGGKYLYAWVEESNIASIKFHQKYGMKHDGLWNIVLCLEKNR